MRKIIYNEGIFRKLSENDIYLKNEIKRKIIPLETLFNSTVLDNKPINIYKDKYIKLYNEYTNLEYKNGKYFTNDGGYNGDIKSGQFEYCSCAKYNNKSKYIIISVKNDLTYLKISILKLQSFINSLSEFYGFGTNDKNLEILFNSNFKGKTYNNTNELFKKINETIELVLQNKGKKIPEIPKGYF